MWCTAPVLCSQLQRGHLLSILDLHAAILLFPALDVLKSLQQGLSCIAAGTFNVLGTSAPGRLTQRQTAVVPMPDLGFQGAQLQVRICE